MYNYDPNTGDDAEALRRALLRDIYAGAFAGMPAMLTEENRIKYADEDELLQIAREYGLR